MKKIMAVHTFHVVVLQDEDGKYIAKVPSLPGCHTQADNMEELSERIKEAITLYLEEMGEKMKKLPHDSFIEVQKVKVKL